MSVALFVSLIYFCLLLFYPFISTELGSKSYSVLGIAIRFFESDMTAALVAAAIVVLSLVAVITAFMKKNKPSGVFQLLSCIVLFAAYALLPSLADDGELVSEYSLSSIVNPSFILLSVVAFAFSVFVIKHPDGSIGSKNTAMTAGVAQRNAYPAVNAAPVRQNMYTAPASMPAPAPAPAPAPVPAAPMPAAAPAASGGTYTCPVCGTTQKSDLAFCTFCGNANPNK